MLLIKSIIKIALSFRERRSAPFSVSIVMSYANSSLTYYSYVFWAWISSKFWFFSRSRRFIRLGLRGNTEYLIRDGSFLSIIRWASHVVYMWWNHGKRQLYIANSECDTSKWEIKKGLAQSKQLPTLCSTMMLQKWAQMCDAPQNRTLLKNTISERNDI